MALRKYAKYIEFIFLHFVLFSAESKITAYFWGSGNLRPLKFRKFVLTYQSLKRKKKNLKMISSGNKHVGLKPSLKFKCLLHVIGLLWISYVTYD